MLLFAEAAAHTNSASSSSLSRRGNCSIIKSSSDRLLRIFSLFNAVEENLIQATCVCNPTVAVATRSYTTCCWQLYCGGGIYAPQRPWQQCCRERHSKKMLIHKDSHDWFKKIKKNSCVSLLGLWVHSSVWWTNFLKLNCDVGALCLRFKV